MSFLYMERRITNLEAQITELRNSYNNHLLDHSTPEQTSNETQAKLDETLKKLEAVRILLKHIKIELKQQAIKTGDPSLVWVIEKINEELGKT